MSREYARTDRLVRGGVPYLDDLQFPDAVEVAFVRSTEASAAILDIHTEAARSLDGVLRVYTAQDLVGRAVALFASGHPSLHSALVERLSPTNAHTPIPLLADGEVRYVGQPVAMVVATTRYVAEDAAELVEVNYDAQPAVVDPGEALQPDSRLVDRTVPGNVGVGFTMSTGDMRAAEERAVHRITFTYESHRHVASPMEPRGVLALVDDVTERLVVYSSTQTPKRTRDAIAGALQIDPAAIQVMAPAVGGGFGQKGIQYVEEVLVPMAARELRRPVRWIEDRTENLVAASHGREQKHVMTLLADESGHLLGLDDVILVNLGAFNVTGLAVPQNTACHLLGPYRIPAARIDVTGVLTNTTFTSPYRGAGRPEAVAALERALDRLAVATGFDRVELRRRNLIQPEEMPYDTGLIYRDGAPEVYDSGDYPALLDRALTAADVPAAAPGKGRFRIGFGVAMYIEGTGLGPWESALIRRTPQGRFVVATGTADQGQRHDVAFAQVAAEALGVDPDDIDVVEGNSDLVEKSIGTIASRSVVTAGNAIHQAGVRLRERTDAGEVGATEELAIFEPPTVTFSSGAHAAVVEVDVVTGTVRVLRYGVAHDCGRVLDPVGADSQIRGGVLQGLGGVLLEEMIYSEDGQPVTTTFLDYLLPSVDDLPEIRIEHIESLSTRNPLGVKGLGEGGAIGPPAAVLNAVEHALEGFGVVVCRGPLSPSRVRDLIRGSGV